MSPCHTGAVCPLSETDWPGRFWRRAHHADATGEQPEPAFGAAKTCSTRERTARAWRSAGDVRRHPLASRLLALELRLQPAAIEQSQVSCRAVGGLGSRPPNRGACIRQTSACCLATMCRPSITCRVARSRLDSGQAIVSARFLRSSSVPESRITGHIRPSE